MGLHFTSARCVRSATELSFRESPSALAGSRRDRVEIPALRRGHVLRQQKREPKNYVAPAHWAAGRGAPSCSHSPRRMTLAPAWGVAVFAEKVTRMGGFGRVFWGVGG